jgi:hypothetical protein
VLALSLDTTQLNTLSSSTMIGSDHTWDSLSPLTEISDDEDEAFNIRNFHNNQEVVINTNFNRYLEENCKFPCGRGEEERLDFTKKSRECVEEHALSPSTLEEFASLVFHFFF